MRLISTAAGGIFFLIFVLLLFKGLGLVGFLILTAVVVLSPFIAMLVLAYLIGKP